MAVSLKLETEVKPKFIEVDVSVPASSSTTVEVLPDAGEVVEVRFIGIYFYTGATGSIVRIYDWSGKVIISSGSDSNITVIWGPDQPSQYIMDESHIRE